MTFVKPKKNLGQHFLTDQAIAKQITESLILTGKQNKVLEIGAGTGVLTQFLYLRDDLTLKVIEIDKESTDYLIKQFPLFKEKIITGDFLNMEMLSYFDEEFAIIGNFPYNISNQILFKVFEHKNLVTQVVGMFQKEVAQRICSKPGKKSYGILSVLIQAFYETTYLFTVDEHVFNPPPKVKSGVLRLQRKNNFTLGTDEKLFKRVVKAAFNQRRKTLRNALKPLLTNLKHEEIPFLSQRAEELGYEEFVILTNLLFPQG